MSRLTHLCMGASAKLLMAVGLMTVGLLWTPGSLLAAGPDDGPNGQGCPTIHKIAVGENLTVIAASYEVSLDALVEENGIDDANLIVEGQSLCIPARSGGYGGPNGGSNNGSGVAEWDSYGVPGQGYDPSLLKKQEGNGPEANGPSANDSANHEDSGPYMIPGKSYDPSTWGKLDSYSAPESSEPESSWGVPGKGYDPEYMPKEMKQQQHGPIFPEYVPRVTEEEEPDEPEVPDDMEENDIED